MPKNITRIIKELRKEYKEAYKGILPDEVLAKGNSWFESFLRSEIEALIDEIHCACHCYTDNQTDNETFCNKCGKIRIKMEEFKK